MALILGSLRWREKTNGGSYREILARYNKEPPTRAASGEMGCLGREGFPVHWKCAHTG